MERRPGNSQARALEEREGRPSIVPIAVLFAASCAAYILLGRSITTPIIAPDEFTYGGLARSIADGDGRTLLGQHPNLPAALYVYVIAPAWSFTSTETAYAVSKAIGAICASAAAIPVWLLTRRLTSDRWALAAAALTVGGTWMVVTSALLLENAAYPLATAALTCTVSAIARPRSRSGWYAVMFAVLAAAARLQLAALVPLIAVALLIDVARARSGWRARLTEHRFLLLVTGGASATGLIAVAAWRAGTLGAYGDLASAPDAHGLVNALAWQSVGFVLMLGVIPLVAVAAMHANRRAWRDDQLGPVLVVLCAATAMFVTQSAWAVARFEGLSWHIQRYEMYIAPLVAVAFVAGLARSMLTWRALCIWTAVTATALAFAPPVRNAFEEPAQFAIGRRVHEILGVSATAGPFVWTLVAGAVMAVVVRLRPQRAGAVVLGLAFLALVVQDEQAWRFRARAAEAFSRPYPSDLQWVDHAGTAPAAILVGTSNTLTSDTTKLFNRSIRSQLLPNASVGGRLFYGRICRWAATPTGTLQITGGCAPSPHRFYLEDPLARFTLHDQTVQVEHPGLARVVTVPLAAPPRLLGLLNVLCRPRPIMRAVNGEGRVVRSPLTCPSNVITGQFWLDRPGVLELRFRGGTTAERIGVLGRVRSIPPGVTTTVRLPVATASAFGPIGIKVPVGWIGVPPAVPALVGARIVSGDTSVELLY